MHCRSYELQQKIIRPKLGIIKHIMNAEKIGFYFEFQNRETKMTKSEKLLSLQNIIFIIYIQVHCTKVVKHQLQIIFQWMVKASPKV